MAEFSPEPPPFASLTSPSEGRYRAGWVLPGDGSAHEDAMIVVDDGLIVDVTRTVDRDLPARPDRVLLPPLINCHTHLEFSGLPRPVEPFLPFPEWIQRVIRTRQERNEPTRRSIEAGCRETLTAGVGIAAEIATTGWEEITFPTPRLVMFQEVLGLTAARIEEQWNRLQALFRRPAESLPPGTIRGVSPHAPYTVHPELFDRLIRFAVAEGAPVAMHLAETTAERALLERGEGEFVSMLQQFGIWNPSLFGDRTVLDLLGGVAEARRGLVVHGNYLSEEEIEFVAERPQLSVVYCPRTHANFGHAPHPWLKIRERGGRVVIGTDSRASNPDLSIWEELRFLARRHPTISHLELVKTATSDAAEALGLNDSEGILAPGRPAKWLELRVTPLTIRDPRADLLIA